MSFARPKDAYPIDNASPARTVREYPPDNYDEPSTIATPEQQPIQAENIHGNRKTNPVPAGHPQQTTDPQ